MPRLSATVVDHFTNPRNCGELSNADVHAFQGNQVRGDQILSLNEVTRLDITTIEELTGGLAPDQRHVAARDADVGPESDHDHGAPGVWVEPR